MANILYIYPLDDFQSSGLLDFDKLFMAANPNRMIFIPLESARDRKHGLPSLKPTFIKAYFLKDVASFWQRT